MAATPKIIGVVGNHGVGKSAFIQVARGVPPSKAYHSTVGVEMSPTTIGTTVFPATMGTEMHRVDMGGDNVVYLWEFGRYSNKDILNTVDCIIYITNKEETEYDTDKPYVVVVNKDRSAVFNVENTINELLSKL